MYKRHPCCQIQWTFLSSHLSLQEAFDMADHSFLLRRHSSSRFCLLDSPSSPWHAFRDLLILDHPRVSALRSLLTSIYAHSLGGVIQSLSFKF